MEINKIISQFKENQADINNALKLNEKIIETLCDKKIVIYPAGMLGQLLCESLKAYDIEIKNFYDKNYSNLKSIQGIEVLEPDKLKDITNDFIVIIAANIKTSFNFFYNNACQINPQLNIVDGRYLNRLLKYKECDCRFNEGRQINLYECEHCGFERQYCPIATKSIKKFANHKQLPNDTRSKSFDWFGYIVSQTCTLKCKHCCEQVPMLKDSGFTPVEELVKDVKKIAESCQWLNFVELIGGEPFLHPHIEELLEELLKIENIGYIKSFTNATVIPSDRLCEIMKNPRFMLHLSNYEKTASGKLLENIFTTRKKLKDKNVNYLFTKNFEWLDFTSFDLNPNNTKEEKLKEVFDNCFLINCHRVYKGVLYRCPHQYTGIQLNKLQKLPIECVDIHALDKDKLAQALEAFENVDYIDACRYCKLPFDAKVVPAGEQLEVCKNA